MWRIMIALSVLALLPSTSAAQGQARRMNVLLITVDDLRNELGCYGVEGIKTPNIDRLAGRGMRFDRAYCQYPVCNPSRTSLLTGLRPDSTKILDNGTHFRKTIPDVVTLPQQFRANGYYAASLGKIFHRGLTMEDLRPEMDDPKSWDVAKYFEATAAGNRGEGRNLTGGRVPWCRWLAAEGGDEDHPDGQIAREGIRLMEENRERPFFLALGFHKPHDPFVAPKKYFDEYPLEEIELAKDPAGHGADVPLAIGGGAWKKEFDAFTDQERREFKRAYYAGVSFVDAQVGKVLAALERLGLAQRTVVVFLGDHGYHLGERGWWNKNTLFELSARAPLMVYAPGAKGMGKACARLVEFLDLYPTLTELCGIDAPKGLEGRSFVPLLDDPVQPWKAAAFTQVRRGRVDGRSVRTERFRYTEWDGGKQGVELYDHEVDPGEWKNLAKEPAHEKTVADLRGMLRGEKTDGEASAAMQHVRVADDGRGFVLHPSGAAFVPWGLNYGNKGRLIEDYWDTEWTTVVEDFQEMKALGANVVRVHLQFGKFVEGPGKVSEDSLRRLGELVKLAEEVGIYLDVTGLACYRPADTPKWYDALEEEERWAAQAAFWEAVAGVCAESPAIFCYDLMNEPLSPGGKREAGQWYSGKLFGGYDFLQWIALEQKGRKREEIAAAWIRRMTEAIRRKDKEHLITVGLLPWSREWKHLSGFVPETIGAEVDFVSVHIYPEKGKIAEAMEGLRKFAVGKPVVIEETFPLACSGEELKLFLRESKEVACGWMGHYDGETVAELEGLAREKRITIAQSMWLEWLKVFAGMRGEVVRGGERRTLNVERRNEG